MKNHSEAGSGVCESGLNIINSALLFRHIFLGIDFFVGLETENGRTKPCPKTGAGSVHTPHQPNTVKLEK